MEKHFQFNWLIQCKLDICKCSASNVNKQLLKIYWYHDIGGHSHKKMQLRKRCSNCWNISSWYVSKILFVQPLQRKFNSISSSANTESFIFQTWMFGNKWIYFRYRDGGGLFFKLCPFLIQGQLLCLESANECSSSSPFYWNKYVSNAGEMGI